MLNYESFINSKRIGVEAVGFEPGPISAPLFPFQRRNVEWACRLGRCALFLDTGLGKTAQQLEWALQVCNFTGGRVLILAPLAVGKQTAREAGKFNIGGAKYALNTADANGARIVITNYERLEHFDAADFAGVVLDESGILKQYSGAMKVALCEAFARTPYRLACTATPAPNDHTELGNHAEFLGVMRARDMLTAWFCKEGTAFRLKGHAVESFWDWVSSWAVLASLPSDIGDYSDDGYVLPQLTLHRHIVSMERNLSTSQDGLLFDAGNLSATTIQRERKRTSSARSAKVAEIVQADPGESWIVWCETDNEADELMGAMAEISPVEVRGSDTPQAKEKALVGFTNGDVRVLITKPKIAGYGLNWQHCARVVFAGTTFSFESYYQAIRRSWRFGQTRPVQAHVVMAETERGVWSVLERKRMAHEQMKAEMLSSARRRHIENTPASSYLPRQPITIPEWLR